jgi:hypothetical protein
MRLIRFEFIVIFIMFGATAGRLGGTSIIFANIQIVIIIIMALGPIPNPNRKS